MLKKKIILMALAFSMSLGFVGGYGIKGNSLQRDMLKGLEVITELPEDFIGGPVDVSIANEEKIIEMLKREGKIADNLTFDKALKAYQKYMKNASEKNNEVEISKMEKSLRDKRQRLLERYKFQEMTPDTNPKKVKVLVLLADFLDYKNNSITKEETDMFYEDYTKEHFEDMLFSDKGYTGPNGENLISMKQYYQEQSSGSLIIEGQVAGWYTAPQNAAYYGAEVGGSHDVRPRNLVAHTLASAAKDTSINLADYDKEDIYDLDGDGNYNEPDGIIDHLMVIHAGVGQEAGGGSLGSDAIWSHRWNLGGLYKIPGTDYYAYDYTIEPEDGAAGVFAHEFGHDLGLPDEYDTQYTSTEGEPISRWSLMSSGSWAGRIPGTEPTGLSPYARQYFQAVYGGNWQNAITIDYEKIPKVGAMFELEEASSTGQTVRINLPDKKHNITKPYSGEYAYWGGKGSSNSPINTFMTTKVNLLEASDPKLQFKTWYDIEEGWDFASVQARESGASEWTYLQGNITTTEHDPDAEVVLPHGITGTSGGWIDGSFDLSSFAGKEIELKFAYNTDSYVFGAGLYVDDIIITSSKGEIFSDNGEAEGKFNLQGFTRDKGYVTASNYYLIEWRSHNGVDQGLAHMGVYGQVFSYDPGIVVWYVDDYYTDNWTGVHPGDGFLGVVDADQKSILWTFADGITPPMKASGTYQMRDAAFNIKRESELKIDLTASFGRTATDNNRDPENKFEDSKNYLNSELPGLGRNIPKLGIKIQILGQGLKDKGAKIIIKK